MTLNTTVYVLGEVDLDDLFTFCQNLLDADRAPTVRTEDREAYGGRGCRLRQNVPGQGLPAWLTVDYRPGGELRTPEAARECDECCEAPCAGGDHPPACRFEVSFDTAYSYRDEQGRGCGDLHALYVARLGLWLEERGGTWAWQNEFTGDVHSGADRYDRLAELSDGGARATEWLDTVLPAIIASGATR